MVRDPYELKRFDKWSPSARVLRGSSELVGGGRKRWLADQAEKAKQPERKEDRAASPELRSEALLLRPWCAGA